MKNTIISDIDAKKCSPTGKYYRSYKGDITIRTGNTSSGRKDTSDVNWSCGTAKLDVKVLDQLEIKFDQTHPCRLCDDDFSSKTLINEKLLRSDNKRSSSYSGSIITDDGKRNEVPYIKSKKLGNVNTDKICPLYGKSRLDNHSNHQITQLTLVENISTTNELIKNLHNKGLAK
ncbi:unnamed protein product [Rotaria sp. Silwood2]|nr:unnamed protein product [Rotaria sp. Silwood2]CAF2675944.1 unnamed protein product [Rotaria sp. Silwood2]CAF2955376.1 unnamed protein product [Rotaria sp. Silwood2]CAF3101168.1 unnamed protein product [Rotaria sp. Silwood2]CAF4328280.1 unnamed protein product [Rotaria sp. Silwood2]